MFMQIACFFIELLSKVVKLKQKASHTSVCEASL